MPDWLSLGREGKGKGRFGEWGGVGERAHEYLTPRRETIHLVKTLLARRCAAGWGGGEEGDVSSGDGDG